MKWATTSRSTLPATPTWSATRTPTTSPPSVPFRPTASNGEDIYVTKVGPTGSAVYSTYVGGQSHDRGYAIAVDASGSAT